MIIIISENLIQLLFKSKNKCNLFNHLLFISLTKLLIKKFDAKVMLKTTIFFCLSIFFTKLALIEIIKKSFEKHLSIRLL